MKVENRLHLSSNNYDRLFQEQMKNPEFVKAYNEAKLERRFLEILEDLKDKIIRNEPREVLLETIREVTKNNLPIIAPNFGSYSRRGNRCILEYSPIAATKNTGQKASKMGRLFFVTSLNTFQHPI